MLQYYDFSVGVNSAMDVGAAGKYLYYYSGQTPSSHDNTILVRPGITGNTIILKPGQSVRLGDADKEPTQWRIQNYKSDEAISGILIVGNGEFRDNSGNVTLTGGTNNLAINNTPANPVPVTAPVALPVTATKAGFSSVSQGAPVTVGTAVVGTGYSDATCKRLVFRNAGLTGNIAIGNASVTMANSAVQLGPGESWIEDQPGTVAFCAISDTAGSTLTITVFK